MVKSYKELAKAKIQEKRNIVISSVTTEKKKEKSYTLAQQVEVEEGNKKTNLFLKGAIIVENYESLIALRDALNVAISKEEIL